ncbi:AP-3 complex subunit delta, partial [Linderina macrospora]
MFEKTLTDLIQGLRANKRNESEYIGKSLEEIQNEVQLSDMHYKSVAIDKLNYLHMLGYDMNWANFNVVEVMSSAKFGEKRSGYLAATQSFNQDTDVLMLATNLIRKDLSSSNFMEVSIALDGLAQIATAELAMDLFDDVLAILDHSRPYIRKKAIVCLYKMTLKHPEGLHDFVPQLKERLDDPDPSVVSSAVSVICELAHTNPRNYLPLAPKLYHLLNSSNNNWMLIKIVKLFASLTPIEPRLAKKLHGPLSNLICTTTAMSLLYECINTAVVGDIISVPLPVTDSIGREIDFAELCAHKLEVFYDSSDHNLRYVGLVTLAELQVRRPDLVVNQYETILRCLDDPDMGIRMRALQVVSGMATRKNLTQIAKRLMSQLILSHTIALKPGNTDGEPDEGELESSPLIDPSGVSLVSAKGSFTTPKKAANSSEPNPADSPEYRLAAVEAILDMCSRQSYANMTNFEWYVAVLVDLVYIAGVDVGHLLSQRLLDATVRVRQVREYSVRMMRRLLSDSQLTEYVTGDSPNAAVLSTAAYILGEYCALVPASCDDIGLLLLPSLRRLTSDQQATFVLAAMKVYTNWLQDVSGYWNDEIWELVRSTNTTTMDSVTSLFFGQEGDDLDMAVAELPLQVESLLRHFIEITKAVSVATSNMSASEPLLCRELHSLFTMYELNPVSAAAQGKVPVPEGLDLESWIGDEIPDTSLKVIPPPPPPPTQRHVRTAVDDTRTSGSRKADRKNQPFYLEDAADRPRNMGKLPDVEDIPVMQLDLGDLAMSQTKSRKSDKPKKKKKSKSSKRYKKRTPEPSPPIVPVDIVGDEDMPDIP